MVVCWRTDQQMAPLETIVEVCATEFYFWSVCLVLCSWMFALKIVCKRDQLRTQFNWSPLNNRLRQVTMIKARVLVCSALCSQKTFWHVTARKAKHKKNNPICNYSCMRNTRALKQAATWNLPFIIFIVYTFTCASATHQNVFCKRANGQVCRGEKEGRVHVHKLLFCSL